MAYIDGFLIPVPRRNLGMYRSISRRAGKIWMDLGAVEYRECVGDDMGAEGMTAFPKAAKAKSGEVVVFSWILYKSKSHRNKVNAKVMKDPRILRMMKSDKQPFETRRMAFGGFKVIVDKR